MILIPRCRRRWSPREQPFAIVALRSAASLERLRVNQEQATRVAARARRALVLCARSDGKSKRAASLQWRARMQFYGGEDPATGSAAGCAISYLVSSRRGDIGSKNSSSPRR